MSSSRPAREPKLTQTILSREIVELARKKAAWAKRMSERNATSMLDYDERTRALYVERARFWQDIVDRDGVLLSEEQKQAVKMATCRNW